MLFEHKPFFPPLRPSFPSFSSPRRRVRGAPLFFTTGRVLPLFLFCQASHLFLWGPSSRFFSEKKGLSRVFPLSESIDFLRTSSFFPSNEAVRRDFQPRPGRVKSFPLGSCLRLLFLPASPFCPGIGFLPKIGRPTRPARDPKKDMQMP